MFCWLKFHSSFFFDFIFMDWRKISFKRMFLKENLNFIKFEKWIFYFYKFVR